MISYKRDVLERQSLSEVKMCRDSPICERVRKKIVKYFKNNVPQCEIAKALQISSSTVHNIINRFRETGEISVRKCYVCYVAYIVTNNVDGIKIWEIWKCQQ